MLSQHVELTLIVVFFSKRNQRFPVIVIFKMFYLAPPPASIQFIIFLISIFIYVEDSVMVIKKLVLTKLSIIN
jgi:hypothetical protein